MHYLINAAYLTTLALLPWAWFPPFPWGIEHAQWSDAFFLLVALLWGVDRFRSASFARLRPPHVGMTLYLLFATLSLCFVSPDRQNGIRLLLGMMELTLLAVVTSDMATRPRMLRAMGLVITVSTLASAVAGLAGLLLFLEDIPTRLVGSYGDMVASSRYARIQAGLYNPNLLASYFIFAATVIEWREASVPPWLRRLTMAALWISILLTFSRGIFGLALAVALRSVKTARDRALASLLGCLLLLGIIGLSVCNLTWDPTRPMEMHLRPGSASRAEEAITSFHTLVSHPFLGCGLGTDPGSYLGLPHRAHFTLLNIAATLGLPALIAFLMIPWTLWQDRRRDSHDKAIWAGIAGVGLDALASDVANFRHLWLFFGLADAERRSRELPNGHQAVDDSGLARTTMTPPRVGLR